MKDKLSDEAVDEIIREINRIVNIPFLNEKQEEFLFRLLLSVLIETFIKVTKRPA